MTATFKQKFAKTLVLILPGIFMLGFKLVTKSLINIMAVGGDYSNLHKRINL